MTREQLCDWIAREPSAKRVPKALSVREVTDYIGCNRDTIISAIRSGDLFALRIGTLWRIPVDSLVDWMTLNRPHPRSAIARNAQFRESSQLINSPHMQARSK